MVKASRSGANKADSNEMPQVKAQDSQTQAAGQSATATTAHQKGKQSGKSRSSHKIGGTAVTGAKSTQPKEMSNAAPSNQQAEYYNRDMRRRMQQMGTGPYSERAAVDPRTRKKKRQERLQERQERIKHLVNAKGPSRDVRLGRRNTYFLIGIIAFIVILIVAFILIRHPF